MNVYWAAAYAAVNAFAFILCGLDKGRAKRDKRRVPERALWLFSAFFGALGMYAGMRLFRHKTQKRAFVYGVPLLLIAQVFLLIWLGAFE